MESTPQKLWLWRNFVDGRPEYWAFDNPFPVDDNGDPQTLGEPCGYAIVKPSRSGHLVWSEEEVLRSVKQALGREAAKTRNGVGVMFPRATSQPLGTEGWVIDVPFMKKLRFEVRQRFGEDAMLDSLSLEAIEQVLLALEAQSTLSQGTSQEVKP